MCCMKTKREILAEFYKQSGSPSGVRTDQEMRDMLFLETLLDIRDLLAGQRKPNTRRAVVDVVEMSPKEEELLNRLDV